MFYPSERQPVPNRDSTYFHHSWKGGFIGSLFLPANSNIQQNVLTPAERPITIGGPSFSCCVAEGRLPVDVEDYDGCIKVDAIAMGAAIQTVRQASAAVLMSSAIFAVEPATVNVCQIKPA